MAVIDVAGYVADLKDHSVDHGFHVHDERHFVETYSLRQVWEVELHPEDGCGGPLDLHLALEVDPRTLLSFEDAVFGLPEDEDPPDEFHFALTFTWALPPLPNGPDLLRLAIDLAGVGGIELPLEVSAIDSYASATDAAERRLSIVARTPCLAGPGPDGRGDDVRRLRPLPGRQPLPARLGAQLARVTGPGPSRLIRLVGGPGRPGGLGRHPHRLRGQRRGSGQGVMCPCERLAAACWTGPTHATDPTAAAKLARQGLPGLCWRPSPSPPRPPTTTSSGRRCRRRCPRPTGYPSPSSTPSLRAQCQTADNSVFNQAPPPSSPAGT